ncbi:hypothetical protein [Peptoniphilus stercorisuis]|uniref:Membrane protein YczE n=1 Tax=Peptoniphilus stercorisuis TaxID=1436965 RepID=A0ABS4KEE3_9FIRM|nr:hypothetical protein [Peptoniphilus stercorisuis]MBP2025009.1 putative membrane protein YczE [Peptoniphilus stercorisuis]
MMKILLSLFFYLLGGIGVSLTLKPAIGVSPFNSVCLAFSQAFYIKVGTITFLLNMIYLSLFIYFTKGKLKRKYPIMMISVLFYGVIINLFTYNVFANLIPKSYISKVLIFIFGTILTSFSCSVVLFFNIIPFPVESLCVALSNITYKSVGVFRYSLDIISISTALLLAFLFKNPITVREGTIISFILFPGIFSFFYNYFNKNFKEKLN